MTGTSWPAVLLLARTRWLRTRRQLLVLGLLTGLVAGLALGALSLARRTTSAPDRLADANAVEDARVSLFGGPPLARAVAALPPVRAAWPTENAVGQLEAPGGRAYLSITYGDRPPGGLWTPTLVAGRAPDPDAADQVLVTEQLARRLRLAPGSVLALWMLLPQEVFAFDTGFGDPDGPRLRLRVAGVVRLSSRGGDGFGPVFAGPGFLRGHADLSAGQTLLLRLAPGAAARQQLVDGLALLDAPLPEQAQEFGPLRAVFPREQDDPQVRAAQRVLGGGLGVFAAVVAGAALLALAQALARAAAAERADQRTESALGLVRAERALGRLLPLVPAAGLAGAVAAAVALVAGRLQPLGGLRAFEPSPGWLPDPAVAALGAVTTAVLVLLVGAAAVLRAGGRARTAAPAVAPPVRTGSAVVLAGAALALGRRLPGRAALVGSLVAVTGVVATASFASALHRLEHTPARYGWSADLDVADLRPETAATLAADPDVRDLAVLSTAPVAVEGAGLVQAAALDDRKGALPRTVVAGRLPRQAGEVALGPRTARELGRGVGDVLQVRGSRLRVTGLVVLPSTLADTRLGAGLLVTPPVLTALTDTPPTLSAQVRAAPGAAARTVARYAGALEVVTPEPPPEVRTLSELGRLPEVLQGVLVLLAAAALAHGLLTTARTRRRERAVLRALGLTPAQVGRALLLAAAVPAAVGLLLGVPLGLGVGRLAWSAAAGSTGVGGDPAVPGALLVLLVPGTLLLVAAVAAVPALRAARLSPAPLLRET